MIFKMYGLNINLEEVKNEMIMDSEGANAYEVIRISKKHGISATGYKDLQLDKIKSYPFIAHTVNNGIQHFVVVIKITYDEVYVLDPAKGKLKVSKKDFQKIYTGVIITFKKNTYSFKNLFKDRKIIFMIIFLIMFLSLINISYSYILSYIIGNLDNNLIFSFILLLLIVSLLREIITFIKKRILLDLQVKTDLKITLPTIRRILSLPLKSYANLSSGSLVAKLNDLSHIKEMAYYTLEILLVNMVILIIFLLCILFINTGLFFINVFTFVIIFFLNKRFYRKYHYKTYELQVKNESFSSSITDALNGITTVKNLSKEHYFNNQLKLKYKSLINEYNTTSFIYLKKQFVIKIIFSLLYIFCFIILINNKTTNVNLIFTIYIETMLLDCISSLHDVYPIYVNYKSAKKRIEDIYDVVQIKTGKKFNVINNIMINNLSYKYHDKVILNNVNLKIEKGNYVFIFGKSGIGKTTLFKILSKQIKIKNNMVFINEVDINNIEDSYLKKKMIYVDQKTRLFNKSIKENIYLGSKNKLGKNVKKVIDDMLAKANLNYEYVIDNVNSNISGGQKSIIIIAQSLVNYSDVIIFDEITSQLDESSERKIINAIKQDYPAKTVILTSHRMSNSDMFDKVIKLDKLDVSNKKKKED